MNTAVLLITVTFHLNSYEIRALVVTEQLAKQERLVPMQLKLDEMRSRTRFRGKQRLILAFASFSLRTTELATTQTQLTHKNITISIANNRNSPARVMSACTSILTASVV